MKRIFFIPGLGANEMAFEKIGDLGFEKINIKWIDNNENESLNQYAHRLIDIYKIDEIDIVSGLSFGGLLAQEIARILNQKEVILISSFRDIYDLRYVYRLGLRSGLYKLAPSFRVPIVDEIVAYNLNSENQDSKPILKQMLEETNYELLNWSLQKIAELPLKSNEDFIAHNIIGNKDKILKTWKNDQTIIINEGSHFMVYEQAEEVTRAIKRITCQE